MYSGIFSSRKGTGTSVPEIFGLKGNMGCEIRFRSCCSLTMSTVLFTSGGSGG